MTVAEAIAERKRCRANWLKHSEVLAAGVDAHAEKRAAEQSNSLYRLQGRKENRKKPDIGPIFMFPPENHVYGHLKQNGAHDMSSKRRLSWRLEDQALAGGAEHPAHAGAHRHKSG
jgi:hypothetical protein